MNACAAAAPVPPTVGGGDVDVGPTALGGAIVDVPATALVATVGAASPKVVRASRTRLSTFDFISPCICGAASSYQCKAPSSKLLCVALGALSALAHQRSASATMSSG